MSLRLPLLILVSVCVLPLAGCRHVARRAEPRVSLLVSGPVELELLPRAAALAAACREQGEAAWLVVGPVGADGMLGCVTGGRGVLRALAASGVDVAVFGPEWLEFGSGAAARLVSSSDLQLLSCNIADSLGEPIGHPMLLQRLGGSVVGLTAAWTDTAEPRLRVANVRLLPADRAAGRVLGLLRMHCDAAGLVLQPEAPDFGAAAGYDFVLGSSQDRARAFGVPADPGRALRLDLQPAGGRAADLRVAEQRLADWPELPEARRVIDSLQAVVDSALAVPVAANLARTGPEVLTRMLQDVFLARGFDGFLFDRPLFDRALGPGAVDARAVREAMPEPGRPGVVELTGWMVEELIARDGVSLRWSPELSRRQLVMPQRYRLVAMPGFLARHPKAALDGYEVDDEPLWRAAARMLAREQR